MNTNSGNYRKSVHVPPESLFTFNQNWCSPSAGITVHLAPEYAHNDVIATAEASQRPKIISVSVKKIDQQNIQSLHRFRDLCVSRRTSLMNQTRGLLG